MPTILTPQDNEFASGPFNGKPFGLQTIMPGLFRRVASEHLIFDMRTLAQEDFSFPYHYHRNAEEVMLIVSGEMTVRTPNGFLVVKKGQVLFCEKGEDGAHQFFNHTNELCSYFDVKTFFGMDVVVYPDSDKIMISQYNEVFEHSSKVDYLKGEEAVAEKWKSLGYVQ